ncbi:hypothetical protein WOLCODRAFT_23580 [Wolfiporia cocos MD-104 SS10]|uniref:Uncharacterized protein n=1 Tax=Wolfiporia cocos (strain MD-104) TaxID=742152 RepID=A0A2H3JUC2_WOLCO|nr:hypothetical protein WOLCODRAFT_23580 [Wolfiporia cocos MD-104 SS10]
MHSPNDPDSSSDTDNDQQMFEETSSRGLSNRSFVETLFSMGGMGNKRRGPHGPSSSTRDPKSRRREEAARRGAYDGIWESGGTREPGTTRSKDEPVDSHVVETLRNQFGDPFDDAAIKAAA